MAWQVDRPKWTRRLKWTTLSRRERLETVEQKVFAIELKLQNLGASTPLAPNLTINRRVHGEVKVPARERASERERESRSHLPPLFFFFITLKPRVE